ncbi:MAG: DNA/RNA non-specific endonuclease [Symploca sp. SIO1B1]|nr:DNA/RNA non-specific endonuclease [Symploca sp. SIO1B1]
MLLGNPSGASSKHLNNFLIEKHQYALSYSCDDKIPKWVSWQLNKNWLGESLRQDNFSKDPDIPEGCYAVKPTDYRGSGYHRGHMAPSADRTKSVEDNSATFLMTNIIPQHEKNNVGVWKTLEAHSRELVEQGKELYIIAGGLNSKTTIGSAQIKVPEFTWKVIVVLDTPGIGLNGITRDTKTIAVMIPNSEEVDNKNWEDYQVSIDYVEEKTKYNFLSNVPDEIENEIEVRGENSVRPASQNINPRQIPTVTVSPTPQPSDDCDPNYTGACIPTSPSDLNCGDITARRFQSIGSDPHGFDRDKNGIACES